MRRIPKPFQSECKVAQGVVIAATGLKAEARIAEKSQGVRAVIGGGIEDQLATRLQQAAANGAAAFISFGIAGGLRPGLKPGTIIIGTSVIHSSGRVYSPDTRWSDRLFEALPNAESGPIVGSSTIIASRDEKRAIYLASGAFAADMESQIVAQIDFRLAWQNREVAAALSLSETLHALQFRAQHFHATCGFLQLSHRGVKLFGRRFDQFFRERQRRTGQGIANNPEGHAPGFRHRTRMQ